MNTSLSLLSCLLLTTGCAVETVTTEIRVRDPSRGALVRTDVTGSKRLPLPADGVLTLDANAATTITLGSNISVARWCTPVTREPRGEKLEFTVVPNAKCPDSPVPGSIGYALDAPWADVRIVEHHRPDRAGAWAIVGLSTVLYGALAATVFLAPHIRGGPSVRYGLGGAVAGIGAAFDAAMLPTLVAPDEDVVVHDFGPPLVIVR